MGWKSSLKQLVNRFLSIARRFVPGVDAAIERELAKEVAKIEESMHGQNASSEPCFAALPRAGMPPSALLTTARTRKAADEERARAKGVESAQGVCAGQGQAQHGVQKGMKDAPARCSALQ